MIQHKTAAGDLRGMIKFILSGGQGLTRLNQWYFLNWAISTRVLL